MGIGTASGENRASEAARAAISSPLLEISINGAKGVLFSIAGGDDLTMFEIQDAAKVITESVDNNAKIIFGTIRDEKLKKGEVKVTVIASNFSDNNPIRKAPSLFQTFGQEDERKGKIFNTILSGNKEASKPVIEETPIKASEEVPPVVKEVKNTPPTPTTQPNMPIEDNDDDWSAVPAFLRRSKLK
jgi:cell division protein FtsZ